MPFVSGFFFNNISKLHIAYFSLPNSPVDLSSRARKSGSSLFRFLFSASLMPLFTAVRCSWALVDSLQHSFTSPTPRYLFSWYSMSPYFLSIKACVRHLNPCSNVLSRATLATYFPCWLGFLLFLPYRLEWDIFYLAISSSAKPGALWEQVLHLFYLLPWPGGIENGGQILDGQ